MTDARVESTTYGGTSFILQAFKTLESLLKAVCFIELSLLERCNMRSICFVFLLKHLEIIKTFRMILAHAKQEETRMKLLTPLKHDKVLRILGAN